MSTVETTREQLEAQIEALKAEKAKLLSQERSEFRLAVTEKGGVSIYGLGGRFPVTLYPSQMEKFIGHLNDIQSFMAANKGELDGIAKARQAAKNANK